MFSRPLADLSTLTTGGSWELVNPNAASTCRGWGQLLCCQEGSHLTILGGFDAQGFCLSDIHVSFDSGASWELVSEDAPWLGRSVFAAGVSECGSFMYVMGGVCPVKGGFCNDVWLSRDGGSTWKLQADSASWEVRSGFGLAVNPRDPLDLSIFGGSTLNFACLNDTWRSLDGGVTWSKISAGPWGSRVDFAVVQLPSGRIILAGGDDWEGRFFNDLWVSDDRGESWTSVNLNCDWSPRAGLAMVATSESELVVFGGNSTGLKPAKQSTANLKRLEDVWKSFDGGSTWISFGSAHELGKRTMSCAVKGRYDELILLGGWRDDGFTADVWRSRSDVCAIEEEKMIVKEILTSSGLVSDVLNYYILPYLYGH